jgi:inosine-uridine nucleoside N-ribohydrolase
MTKKIIIDTDPGADDTAAILLALASEELSVQALTVVFGNGEADVCTRNALTILEVAGRSDIPVYTGANKPLIRPVRYGYYVHGENAFSGAKFDPPRRSRESKHAANAIVDLIMSNPGEITLVALGPLTNVAIALSIEPRIAEYMKELVVMGGAVLTYGNASEVASANLFYDPEAAAIVYQSGAPLVQSGLDVCRRVIFSHDDIERIRQTKTSTTDMLIKVSAHLAWFYQSKGNLYPDGYVGFNDVPAIAYLINPGFYEICSYHVSISIHDEITRGQTVADVAGLKGLIPNARVLMNVDAASLKKFFIERIGNYKREGSNGDQ